MPKIVLFQGPRQDKFYGSVTFELILRFGHFKTHEYTNKKQRSSAGDKCFVEKPTAKGWPQEKQSFTSTVLILDQKEETKMGERGLKLWREHFRLFAKSNRLNKVRLAAIAIYLPLQFMYVRLGQSGPCRMASKQTRNGCHHSSSPKTTQNLCASVNQEKGRREARRNRGTRSQAYN